MATERGEHSQDRGRQRARIIGISPCEPARIVLLVRNGHDDLERRTVDAPLCRHQTAGIGVAQVGRSGLRHCFASVRAERLSDGIGEHAGSCAQNSVVADKRQPPAWTEIQFAVVARKLSSVERDHDNAGEQPGIVGELARELNRPLSRRAADDGLADEEKIAFEFRCA